MILTKMQKAINAIESNKNARAIRDKKIDTILEERRDQKELSEMSRLMLLKDITLEIQCTDCSVYNTTKNMLNISKNKSNFVFVCYKCIDSCPKCGTITNRKQISNEGRCIECESDYYD